MYGYFEKKTSGKLDFKVKHEFIKDKRDFQ
jgi:hypothetical protein